MAAKVTVGTTATEIVAPSAANRFVSIRNDTGVTVFLSFDGTVVDAANGFPLLTANALHLITTAQVAKGVYGLVASGTQDVMVQKG